VQREARTRRQLVLEYPKRSRRSNTTSTSKRQCVREQPDEVSSSNSDGEVYDDAPLTRANIPKIVEAVMSQFPKEGGDESEQDDENEENPHLGK